MTLTLSALVIQQEISSLSLKLYQVPYLLCICYVRVTILGYAKFKRESYQGLPPATWALKCSGESPSLIRQIVSRKVEFGA